MKKHLSPEKLIQKIAELAWLKKADDIIIIDLRKISSRVCDLFLLCTGVSELHVKAVADGVIEGLKEIGEKPWHVEGIESMSWILIDNVDVITHVLSEESRAFYSLEKLWGDGKIIPFTEESLKKDIFARAVNN